MSSRQQEKERRRQERLAREAAEARAAARRRRLQMAGGGVLALLAVAAIVFGGLTALTGGDEDDEVTQGISDEARAAAAKLPEQKQTDPEAAAKAAGCVLEHPKYEGAGHEERDFTAADYKTNPPTSGAHHPLVAEDGIYAPGDAAGIGNLVHTLEHGRINVQYRPGTSADLIGQLEGFVAENDGYHMVMYENQTKMPYAVAATAWTHLLGCKEMNPQVWDALRTFRDKYLDKGPEQVA